MSVLEALGYVVVLGTALMIGIGAVITLLRTVRDIAHNRHELSD